MSECVEIKSLKRHRHLNNFILVSKCIVIGEEEYLIAK